MDCRIRSAHPSPLQQGVQKPQDSRPKKRIKFHGHAHRTGLIVEHNHGAGAHAAAGFRHRGEIHGRVEVLFNDEGS